MDFGRGYGMIRLCRPKTGAETRMLDIASRDMFIQTFWCGVLDKYWSLWSILNGRSGSGNSRVADTPSLEIGSYRTALETYKLEIFSD
jgi:hypothetical protein